MRVFPALLATLLILACGAPREVPVAEVNGASGIEGLASSLEVEVRPGRVHLLLHVTNTGAEPVAFTFPTSQRYDFVVETGDGDRVWQWSSDMAFLQAISHQTLAPGETWDMDAEWDPGDRRGTYVARGWLTSSAARLGQQTPFELP